MYLIANLPPVKCFVRKEYLFDFEEGYGEFEPCVWISVKSIKGKALYIEALLTNYGAVYYIYVEIGIIVVSKPPVQVRTLIGVQTIFKKDDYSFRGVKLPR